MKTFLALFAASLLALLPACSKDSSASPSSATSPTAAAGLPDRDPALAHKLVSEGALLLDVRTPDEYAEGHIDKATNIPVGEFEARVSEVDKLAGGDKSKPIVVYCAGGHRAAKAKKMLLQAGYTQVTNLGGKDDWDAK